MEIIPIKVYNQKIYNIIYILFGFLFAKVGSTILKNLEIDKSIESYILIIFIIFLGFGYYLVFYQFVGNVKGKFIFHEDFVEIKIPFEKTIRINYKDIYSINSLEYQEEYKILFFIKKISKMKLHVYEIKLKNGEFYQIPASKKEKMNYEKAFQKYKKDGMGSLKMDLISTKELENIFDERGDFPNYSLEIATKKLEEKAFAKYENKF